MTEEQSDARAFPSAGAPDAARVKDWLVAYVAGLLEFERSEVRTHLPLGRYGLDSTAAVGMTGDLGDWLGCYIDPTVLYKHKSIDALTDYIVANHEKLRRPEK